MAHPTGGRAVLGSLEAFYENWSLKDGAAIERDVEASSRKVHAIVSSLPAEVLASWKNVVEVGCGYGGFIAGLHAALRLDKATGVDFSGTAVDVAKERFAGAGVSYHACPSLNAAETASFILGKVVDPVDCIVLVDVLEHVPDAVDFVTQLSTICNRFLVKLPVEASLFDNYVMPKEYPGSRHSNGHVREFDVDTVHYFVRQIGLTPVAEKLYVYDMEDAFPPPERPGSLKSRGIRAAVILFKRLMRLMLPRKWFLRLIGGGGYFCVADFEAAHVLRP